MSNKFTKMRFVWTLLFLTLLVVGTQASKKCRALALSGGGDKGAYQASVFIEFTNELSKKEISYDVVTGASAGSLNGAGISLFKPGHEKEAATFIYGLWHSIKSSDILRIPDQGLLMSLLFGKSIFDNSPLIDFLYKQVGDRSINKRFTVVVTNSETGKSEHVDFKPSKTIPDDAIPTIVGSSAIPFAFPPMHRNGGIYIDGGCIWNLDITGAVRRCKEIVKDEKDIIIDVILCSRYYLDQVDDFKNFSPLDHYMRAKEISEWQFNMQDLERAVFQYPDVTFRHVVGPSEVLSGSPIPLDFSPDHLDKCFEIGKKDAKNALALGEGEYLSAMLEHYNDFKNGEDVELRDYIDKKLAMKLEKESE